MAKHENKPDRRPPPNKPAHEVGPPAGHPGKDHRGAPGNVPDRRPPPDKPGRG